jgi:hypothetical protein
MNDKQSKILKGMVIIIGLMLLFPPWHFEGPGYTMGLGHSFIASRPEHYASVDIGTLFVQWIGVGIVGGVFFFLAKDKN